MQNTALTLLYWQVGQRMHKEILGHDRAECGKQILQTLAAKLSWSLFLLELGSGFAFLARQKRFQLDNDDYYIDLLFYHRHLNRLIAIDLKLGDFKAQDKGQMELYLRWLAKNEQRPDEKSPLGIILCAGKKQGLIELLKLG
jgi:hypothetical protein